MHDCYRNKKRGCKIINFSFIKIYLRSKDNLYFKIYNLIFHGVERKYLMGGIYYI
jgi:hypothetical protein